MPILNMPPVTSIENVFFTLSIILFFILLVYIILDIIRINTVLTEQFTDTKKGSFILSTIPSRLPNIKQNIDSLIKNRPKHIYISIPDFSIRENVPYEIPEWLNEYANRSDAIVKIVRCKDYGPATKFMGIIEQKVDIDPDHYIVIVDDDFKYNELVLDNFINRMQIHEKENQRDDIVSAHTIAHLSGSVMGFAGIIMKRKMLDGIENFKNIDECFTTDDAYLTAFLKEKKALIKNVFPVPVCDLTISKTPNNVGDFVRTLLTLRRESEINKINPISGIDFEINNIKCLKSLKKLD